MRMRSVLLAPAIALAFPSMVLADEASVAAGVAAGVPGGWRYLPYWYDKRVSDLIFNYETKCEIRTGEMAPKDLS